MKLILTGIALLALTGCKSSYRIAAEKQKEEAAESLQPENTCDSEAVALVLRQQRPEVRKCYRNAIVVGQVPEGRLSLELDIDPHGRARTVTVHEDTIGLASFKDCLSHLARGLEYPKPSGQPCVVIYPYQFSPD